MAKGKSGGKRGGAEKGSRGSIAKAKSWKQLADVAKQRFGMEISRQVQDKTDLNATREFLSGIESLQDDFPTSEVRFRERLETHDRGYAAFSALGLYVNPSWFSDQGMLERSLKKDLGTRWHPADTIASVGAHEYGHAIMYELGVRNTTGWQSVYDWQGRYLSEICKEAKKQPWGKKMTNQALKETISRYGASNGKPWETFAEAFADVAANKSQAGEFSKFIYERVKKDFRASRKP